MKWCSKNGSSHLFTPNNFNFQVLKLNYLFWVQRWVVEELWVHLVHFRLLGEITIKGAKGLVDNQSFMYPVYFENVWHIILNNIIFKKKLCSFIISYHPVNLKSFHCVMKVHLHMQRISWQVLKTKIKYECLLFKLSPNAFKFCMNFNILHKKWVTCLIIHACIETFLHDW